MTFESSGSGTIGSVGQMDPETHKLKFDRDGIGGLIGLHIMNIIFMVLTLFIYRFWALTRVRRAIWPRMSLDGTPLEYTGTGLEIFLGFLKVFLLILLPYGIFSNWVQSRIINPELGLSPLFVALSLVSSLGIFFLYTAARYLAYRYRVNRTQWRGIRGSVGGAAYIYALKWIGYYFLAAITFGIMKPWADVKLKTRSSAAVLCPLRQPRPGFGNLTCSFSPFTSSSPLEQRYLGLILPWKKRRSAPNCSQAMRRPCIGESSPLS